jgi:branched-chain amino acid transport system substrate-binding protein
MKAKFNVESDVVALTQYDATSMMIEVMKKYGTTREAIQKGMKEMPYEGILASYAADAEGNMLRQILIVQVQDKKLKQVEKLTFTKQESERL